MAIFKSTKTGRSLSPGIAKYRLIIKFQIIKINIIPKIFYELVYLVYKVGIRIICIYDLGRSSRSAR